MLFICEQLDRPSHTHGFGGSFPELSTAQVIKALTRSDDIITLRRQWHRVWPHQLSWSLFWVMKHKTTTHIIYRSISNWTWWSGLRNITHTDTKLGTVLCFSHILPPSSVCVCVYRGQSRSFNYLQFTENSTYTIRNG